MENGRFGQATGKKLWSEHIKAAKREKFCVYQQKILITNFQKPICGANRGDLGEGKRGSLMGAFNFSSGGQ